MGDPVKGATGATPWGAIAQGVGGLAQGIIGAIGAANATKKLERMSKNAPQYKGSGGIMNYYNEALSRYGVSPTQSAMYKRQMQNIGRNVATGLSSLQDRRSALAGISSLARGASDATLNAEVAAENEKNRRFSQLGQAAGMKAGEEMKEFQYNKMMPYERQFNLLAQKAGGQTQLANQGFSNIFGGLQNISNMQMYKQIYGK